MQFMAGDFRLSLTAQCGEKSPVLLVRQALGYCKITVDNVVALCVRVTQNHRFFRFNHILAVAVLLIDFHIVHIESSAGNVSGFVGVARPVSAHSQIENEIERLVERSGVCDFTLALGGRIPVVLGMDQTPVHIPTDSARFPFHCEVVVFLRKTACRQLITALTLAVRIPVMDGAIGFVGVVTQYLHNVNLATAGPLPVQILVGWHHPEGGQEPLAFRHLNPCFKDTVLEIMLVLGIYPAGCIGHCPIGILLFYRFDDQASILKINIFGGIHISLQLIVYPARGMQFDIPVTPV